MGDYRLEKKYAAKLARQEAQNAKNILEGRTGSVIGKGTNIGGQVPSATDTLGMDAITKYRGNLKNAADELEEAGKVINEDTSMLRNSKGFGKLLPIIGMGAAGLAALNIGNQVQAGEYGKAALDTADLATDYVPILGQAKFALRPSELGNSELPPEIEEEKKRFNELKKRMEDKNADSKSK